MAEISMYQKIVDLLNQEIPDVNRNHLKRIGNVIVGEDIDYSMDDIALILLKSDIPLGKILAVLLRCEWLSVQHLLEQSRPDNIQQQVKIFSNGIEHFNLLQDAVVKAADKHWKLVIDHERQSRVLAECKADWLEKGSVHFHDYFMEVPVTAKVPFVNFDGDHQIHVKATPELGRVFSVSGHATDALISSPDRKYNLQVRVLQCRDMRLSLSIISVKAAMQESRKEVRVRMDGVVVGQIDLNNSHGMEDKHVSAKIIDMSCAGVKLCLDHQVVVQCGDMVAFKADLGTSKLELKEAKVCWVSKEDEGDMCLGLMLTPKKKERETIYRYLFIQQQKIAGRIHQLGRPTWMK